MPNTLLFPDGVRLARKDEIPGSYEERAAQWARIQSANITSGFVLKASNDVRFAQYAEINVDAPSIWPVFRELCQVLLSSTAALLIGDLDSEPTPIGSDRTSLLIAILERQQHQLAHDGHVQFGLLCDENDLITAILVSPTKHFQVWLNDEARFRLVMDRYGLIQHDHLEFIDEYPRVTARLPDSAMTFREICDLTKHFQSEIEKWSSGMGPD